MEQKLFIILLIFPSISLLLIILIFNLLIGLKRIRLWRKMIVRYPKLESKMLTFKPYQNPYGFILILHSDYFFRIIRRYLLFESFSKSKTKDFYKKFYQTGSIKKIKDEEINKDLEFIVNKSSIRDILVTIFLILFIIMFIIGIAYSFSQ